MRANLTRGEGIRRPDRGLDNRHESGPTQLACSAHGRRSGGSAAHNATRDLRDGRASAAARRDPHPSARAVARGRSARLAGPEARAIAKGVTAMSVTVRPYRSGGWEVDITRPASGRHATSRAEARVRVSSQVGGATVGARPASGICSSARPARQRKREVPTLEEFAPRFLDGYARANRQKPSGIAAKETILRVHLFRRSGRSASTRSRPRTCSG